MPSEAAPATTPAARAEGISTRKVWRYEIVDIAAIKRDFLIPDESAIAGLVKASGDKAASIVGGIRVYQETIMSAKAR